MSHNLPIPEICPATAKFSLPQQNPDAVLKELCGDDRLFVQAELAIARCDFAAAKGLYAKLKDSPKYGPSAIRFAVIAAIGLGDLGLFDEIVTWLSVLRRTSSDPISSRMVELIEAWIHQWMWIPTGYPEWICRFDFENVPEAWRDSAAYLGTRVRLTRGQFESAYAAAALMMTYNASNADITARGVYLAMTRAVACRETSRQEEMMKWLRMIVLKLAPHGFLLPLLLFMHGGQKSPIVKLLEEIRPDLLPRFRELDRLYYKNLICVRNRYLNEHVTDRLSFREMYLAMSLKRGKPYGELAARFKITVGRLKNIVSNIYEKLHIHSRGELKDLVW